MNEINIIQFECSFCHNRYDKKMDAVECEEEHKEQNKIEELENKTEFIIRPEHLKLLKELNVSWWSCEFGAPCIDPKRPYGNSDVINDIAETIGCKKDKTNWDSDEEEWTEPLRSNLYWLHRDMQIVLQIVFQTGQISVGKYLRKDKYLDGWKKVEVQE